MLDQNGRLTAVVLTPDLWRQILSALEEAEDRALIRRLRERISARPATSGALMGGCRAGLDMRCDLFIEPEVHAACRDLPVCAGEYGGLFPTSQPHRVRLKVQ
ncbi:MAG: hypothetical protein C0183_15050 [Roseiflexus castenholzii]|uniref:hypothetical protein n=1 Tax=Roseiflexus castenholzii TaxID=120962 RepID=UPI000CC7F9B3|nr:MAG: hypothetical protein C0183_15050 [Roseiflexus castenholzii]